LPSIKRASASSAAAGQSSSIGAVIVAPIGHQNRKPLIAKWGMVQSAVRNPEQRVTARVILNRKSSKHALT
jgi:hypothetical protein